MRRERTSTPDWRDGAAYASLLDADRSLFAWEWLRRDPRYCSAAGGTGVDHLGGGRARPIDFGLVAFEPTGLAVPHARPLWGLIAHPFVLAAEAGEPCSSGDVLGLEALAPVARLATAGECEHLLLSDGLRTIRIDAPRGTFGSGPVCLQYRLAGLASAEPPLLTLRRLLELCRTGRFARSLHRPEARARRWILMLRAWDALACGADQREIAQQLLSRSVSQPRWRSRESSIRSQVQRLVRSARAMASGAYRELLR